MLGEVFGGFKIVSFLGKGAFGSVYKVERMPDKKVFALKTILLDKMEKGLRAKTLNEVRLLASSQHPNIIAFETSFFIERRQTLCIVMEYAEKGDLNMKIQAYRTAKKSVPEELIWKVLFHIAKGLDYLHSNGILHRDIKPANVLQSNSGQFKIADLNLVKIFRNQSFTSTQIGTPNYASPQIWNKQQYGTQVDIWALGAMCYQLAMLRVPFVASTRKQLCSKVLNETPPRITSAYSSQLIQTVDRMMNRKPSERPSAQQLVELSYGIVCPFNQNPSLVQSEQTLELINTLVLPNTRSRWNSVLPKGPQTANGERQKSLKLIVRYGTEESDSTVDAVSVQFGGKKAPPAIVGLRKRPPAPGCVQKVPKKRSK